MDVLTYTPDMQTVWTQRQPRVLIVDDEQFNRRLLNRILSHQCDITEAGSGYEALELIEQTEFDLVILDIMMPGIHGLEVLTEIRNHIPSTDLPVMLVSALHENNDIVMGLQSGANDYIPKPIDAEIVLARVTTQLQLKSAFDIQKQAFIELEKADALKNKLLSIASHDLKSPLSSIYMAETLLRQLTDSEDQTMVKVLDTLKMTANNMNSIIVEFLDMAKLQSNAITVDIEPMSVQAVIDEALQQYQLTAIEKGSRLHNTETDGYIMADYARLKQVLSNLISNALKYSPPDSDIYIRAIEKGNHYVIEVVDQGPGIADTERDKLFTEFGKLSNRPTGSESSTGLGLWIVKQMIELMDGEVGVDCPESGGSVFWVKLPAM